MLLSNMRKLLSRNEVPQLVPASPPPDEPDAGAPSALPDDDDAVWPSARIAVAESLWGSGFVSPGGEDEVIRLCTPIGLSEASSLLLLGAGTGGPSRAVNTAFGAWVGAYEANPRLLAVSNERIGRSSAARRVQAEGWNPAGPDFRRRYYHHCLALEPLGGGEPEPILGAIALALKPAAHLVLVETVADLALDPHDPANAAWARLAHRTPFVPSELSITRILGLLGFDVRIVEDVTHRHMHQVLQSWLGAVQQMAKMRPSMRQAAVLVREAELWLLRLRLMQAGRLRLVRWHSIGRASG